ncbi:hypothetical protein [Photobacterium atrarenae]|uniref:DUF1311 domain-containing protein n=1 Tax=Photobacterium atrarenae TaxID=865757 RepID=A0ABY5GEM7_9GAMM|nr:hypothetical protein [Photobacterium atrarenae]UTV27280.1 hypothetical protein NNL38_13230 [Photobacterium atrarenae]
MRYLLSVALLISSATIAAPDYESCTTDNKDTEICQAYLAGVNQSRTSVETAAMMKQEDNFRTRALEQRVGERYRKSVSLDKLPETSTN